MSMHVCMHACICKHNLYHPAKGVSEARRTPHKTQYKLDCIVLYCTVEHIRHYVLCIRFPAYITPKRILRKSYLPKNSREALKAMKSHGLHRRTFPRRAGVPSLPGQRASRLYRGNRAGSYNSWNIA